MSIATHMMREYIYLSKDNLSGCRHWMPTGYHIPGNEAALCFSWGTANQQALWFYQLTAIDFCQEVWQPWCPCFVMRWQWTQVFTSLISVAKAATPGKPISQNGNSLLRGKGLTMAHDPPQWPQFLSVHKCPWDLESLLWRKIKEKSDRLYKDQKTSKIRLFLTSHSTFPQGVLDLLTAVKIWIAFGARFQRDLELDLWSLLEK